MPFCSHCGQSVNPGATFCPACGTPVAQPPATGASPPLTTTPLAPAPAGTMARPTGVTVVGVLQIIGGSIFALIALFLLMLTMMGSAFASNFADFGPFAFLGAAASVVFMIGALFMAAFAALGIASGVGVLKGASWAWVLTLVFAGLNALGGLSELSQGDFGGVLTLLLAGLVIWYFFTPTVKTWFKRA